MIIICPACNSRYVVDAQKFPAQGRTVRCAKCATTWRQAGAQVEPLNLRAAADQTEHAGRYRAGGFVLAAFTGAALAIAYAQSAPLSAAFPAAAPGLAQYAVPIDGAAGAALRAVASVAPSPQANPQFSIEDPRYDFEGTGPGRALLVAATVRNDGPELPAPLLRISVLSEDGAPLYAADLPPEDFRTTIGPSESAPYFLRLAQPPEGFMRIEAEIVPEAGEAAAPE